MKKITIALLVATYAFFMASGYVYLVAPTTPKDCQASDYSLGIEISPLECTYTVDTSTPPKFSPFYAIATCSKYFLYEYSCGTTDMCSNPPYFCTEFNTMPLGCNSHDNLYYSCYDDYAEALAQLGTSSFVQIAESNVDQCSNVANYKVYPINKCVEALHHGDEWPAVQYKCNSTHVAKSFFYDEGCRKFAFLEYHQLNTCEGQRNIYTCQGY